MTTTRAALAALCLAASAWHAAAEPAAPPEVRRLVYALPVSVPAALNYIAIDQGFFRKQGLEVEGRMFSSGREALQMLLAGQAQLQAVSETPVVHAIVQGNRIVTVATTSRHHETRVLARTDHGIAKPGDLRGKKVATMPGTNADYFMYRFFESQKIPLSEVRITNMAPPDMIVQLAAGDIDAYFAWEPHITLGERPLAGKFVEFPPGPLYYGRHTVNMDPDFASAHPNTVRAVLRALLEAEAYVHAHPAESAALVAKRLHMEPAVVAKLMSEIDYRVELDGDLLPLMTSIARWALAQKKLSPERLPNLRAHLYDQFLRQEKPSAVGL